MADRPVLPAAVYTRISHDPEGLALGVARQQADCVALAARLGLTVGAVFTDNDMGASTLSRAKTRPEYSRMLAGVRAGEFGTVLAYSNSRLTRRLAELEDLIRLHEATSVQIATVVSGQDDLSTADGRMVARIKASVDVGEVERLSERLTSKWLDKAKSGRPGSGTHAFGWQADRVTLDPVEAEQLRGAIRDVLDGLPVRAIVRKWNAQGLTTTNGHPWDPRVLRRVLLSPRLAGIRTYHERVLYGDDGQPVRGQWEPLIDQETADALRAALTRDDRRVHRPRRGARQYLLTGLARCGTCGGPMYGNRGANPAYRCQSDEHGNAASMARVDELVTAVALARLADEDLSAPAPTTPSQDAHAARLAEIGAQIGELMAAYRTRTLSAPVAFAAVEALEHERDELAQRAAENTAPVGPRVHHLDADTWAAMDNDRRRAVLEQLLSAVLIRPAPVRRTGIFDVRRVELVWRTFDAAGR